MGFLREFKEFAIKGNVVDLAVAVIIGGAFGKIVSSFVEDVITPLLLNPALKAAGAENIGKLTWNGVTYGNFLAAIINFLCIALTLFIMIRGINKLKKPVQETSVGQTEDQKLLTEIRDLLKNK
jgi:large conductance mechanosensitive channel